MGLTQNKTFIFKNVPTGIPVPGEDIAVEDRPIDLEAPLPPGGLLVKVLYASFDPYQRGKMRDAKIKSYSPPYQLDAPIDSGVIARVLRSDTSAFAQDDIIISFSAPNAEYAVIPGNRTQLAVKIYNPRGIELPHFLGALGMPGATAQEGLYDIGKPQKGETIFVSSSAGAVGQLVGELAKTEGLKVIGSVGSDEKLDFITKELGFDVGFNYKKEVPTEALKRLAPQGIDIYFENVGGDHLEAALDNLNANGRIIACGMISDYSTPKDKQKGVKGLFQIVSKKLTIQGFLVNLKPDKYKNLQQKVQPLIADGKFKAKIHVTDGIDKAPEGFVGMLNGKNFGKAVLKISDP